ncbi:unnamed protein product [Prorocentrum cordatum]|nr:unnamed protein product [Polarella glacialis]
MLRSLPSSKEQPPVPRTGAGVQRPLEAHAARPRRHERRLHAASRLPREPARPAAARLEQRSSDGGAPPRRIVPRGGPRARREREEGAGAGGATHRTCSPRA